MKKTCDLALPSARAALAIRARYLRQLTGPVRAGDAEGIHEMRVASRRLRAALMEFAPAVGGGAEPFVAQVRSITRDLGRARELDVMVDMLLAWRASAPEAFRPAIAYTLRRLRRFRQAEADTCARVADTVASEDYVQPLRLLLDGLAVGGQCHLKYVRKCLLKREKALRRQFRRWEASKKEARLHRVRIAFKKLRYACEVHAIHYGSDMAAYLDRLKKVQQLLGDWNDCRMLRDEIVRITDGAPVETKGVMPLLARFWDRQAARHWKRFRRKAPAFFSRKQVRRTRALFASPATACHHHGKKKP